MCWHICSEQIENLYNAKSGNSHFGIVIPELSMHKMEIGIQWILRQHPLRKLKLAKRLQVGGSHKISSLSEVESIFKMTAMVDWSKSITQYFSSI